jgi:cell division transport system permease protein
VISWLRQHRQAIAAALGKLAGQKSAGLASALVIGVALSLPAGGYALLESLRALARGLALDPQLSVFLRVEAKRIDADALGARLRADSRVAQLRFVPKETALNELKSADGLADVVGALGRNPLPDAFVIRARDTRADALDALAADLRTLPAVAHVQVDAAWARRLAALAGVGRTALLLLGALLAFGLVAITFNTIRLQILTQRDEIEVSKLIGATDAFIGRPFFYLGLLQGLAGGAVAIAIVWGGITLLNLEVRTLAESYGSEFRFAFLSPDHTLAVLLFAGLLGWVGAFMSVSKYLREIEPK